MADFSTAVYPFHVPGCKGGRQCHVTRNGNLTAKTRTSGWKISEKDWKIPLPLSYLDCYFSSNTDIFEPYCKLYGKERHGNQNSVIAITVLMTLLLRLWSKTSTSQCITLISLHVL